MSPDDTTPSQNSAPTTEHEEIRRLLYGTSHEVDELDDALASGYTLHDAVGQAITAYDQRGQIARAIENRALRAEWALRDAGLPVPRERDGAWEWCSPTLLESLPNMACARLPRRPGPEDIGHEHWLPISGAQVVDRPEPAASEPVQDKPSLVSWDDLAVGQVIRFRYRNRSQRLSLRPAKVCLARVRHVWRPEDNTRYPQLGLEVLKADLTRNNTIGFHTLHCGPEYAGLADVIEIVHHATPPAVSA